MWLPNLHSAGNAHESVLDRLAELPDGILGNEVLKLRQIRLMQTQAEEDLRRRFARLFPVATVSSRLSSAVSSLLAVVSSCSILSAQNTPPPNNGLRIIVASSAEQAQQILDRLKNGRRFRRARKREVG